MKEPNVHTINLYAGRPGAGKTLWARSEVEAQLTDKNNIVVYIGSAKEIERFVERAETLPGQLFVADNDHAAEAIGRAVDAANQNVANADTDEQNAVCISIYYDQCWHSMFYGYRDLLVAAAKAGVSVHVLCQVFHQVDKGDLNWLAQNCNCSIISKGRQPRVAQKNEIEKVYR